MTSTPIPPPIAMLAELTHRCPLSCPYCSNPVEMARIDQELGTDDWRRVFREAADLGVLQLHLSGGEPASRRDLEDLVTAAREAGLYTNLITSGIGLTEKRLRALDAAGLDHVQLSLQGTNPEMADEIGGYRGGFSRKLQVSEWIGAIGFPLTLYAAQPASASPRDRDGRGNGRAPDRGGHRAVSRLGAQEPRRLHADP